MNPTRLAGFDLNLLVIFDVLVAERSVTRAAKRLGLSQPAVSNALARLRESLGDRLLVRASHGMVPTSRALVLQRQLGESLDRIGSAIDGAASFDPRTAQRTFVLVATDYVQFVMLGALLSRVRRTAPGVVIHILPPVKEFPWHQLEDGSIDLILGGTHVREVPTGLHRRWIFRDQVVCILRNSHPYANEKLTLEHYLELDHVEALPVGSLGLADRVLSTLGHQRRVVLTVPHFLIAPFLVMQSDCSFTLAHRIGKPLEALLPLCVRPLPFEMPSVTIGAFWHDRVHHDPAHSWLRRLIVETTEGLDRAHSPTGTRTRRR
jgi:DNA-binding transcriptional LysR family regulator